MIYTLRPPKAEKLRGFALAVMWSALLAFQAISSGWMVAWFFMVFTFVLYGGRAVYFLREVVIDEARAEIRVRPAFRTRSAPLSALSKISIGRFGTARFVIDGRSVRMFRAARHPAFVAFCRRIQTLMPTVEIGAWLDRMESVNHLNGVVVGQSGVEMTMTATRH